MIDDAPPGFQTHALRIDVTGAAGLDKAVYTVVTVQLPTAETMPERPVVAFGIPGAGLSRAYFTFDMPGATGGRSAAWFP